MIILASGSPRRKELLKQIGIEFTAVKSECDEYYDKSLSPSEVVKLLSLRKGKEVFYKTDGKHTVVSADTVVVLDGEIFGKPKDENDAFNMLKKLNGRTHSVFTGLTVIKNENDITAISTETKVTFKNIDDKTLREYVLSGEPADKAGAYGIQGKGAVLVKEIKGDFYNIVGLPVSVLWDILRKKE